MTHTTLFTARTRKRSCAHFATTLRLSLGQERHTKITTSNLQRQKNPRIALITTISCSVHAYSKCTNSSELLGGGKELRGVNQKSKNLSKRCLTITLVKTQYPIIGGSLCILWGKNITVD